MIIVDLSRVFHATVAVSLRGDKTEVDIGMLRHLILNSLRASNKRFSGEYGQMVLAVDSRDGYWRRDIFPYYKGRRRVDREESHLDWPAIFAHFDQIKEELDTYFPYPFIKVSKAEADDVIGVLTKKYHQQGVLILANDHDFIQLHTLPNVKQWNPVRSKWIREKNPERYLQEHIIRGDKGDGIPSIHEQDNYLMIKPEDERRKSVTQKQLDKWLSADPKLTMKADEYRNYVRNRELIDFEHIPERISDAILENYESQPPRDRKKIFDYCIQNRLRNLMGQIGDF